MAMRKVSCRRTAVVVAAFALRLAHALFEDETGQYEWLVQHIGEPTALAYNAQASDRVVVSSAAGVVASVLLKDGTMQWRRIASTDGIHFLRAGSKGISSATRKGNVQIWKSNTGDLTWQRDYQEEIVDLLLVGKTKQSTVVVRPTELDVRSMTGKHEWSLASSKVLEKPNSRFWAAAAIEDEPGSICAVAGSPEGKHTIAARIEQETGKVLKTADITGDISKALAAGSYMVVDSHLVSIVDGVISAHPICGEEKGDSFNLKDVQTSGKGAFSLMPWQRTVGVFAATNGATTAIFGVGPKGLKKLRTFDGEAVVGPVFSVHDDEGGQPVAVAMLKGEGTQIQLLDPASGNVQPAIHAEGYGSAAHGAARLLLVRELSSGEHRTVLSAADHSIAGIQGAKVVWSREEALSSIQHAFFYGRPIEMTKRPAGGERDAMAELTSQLSELPNQLMSLIMAPLNMITSIQDVFNFVPPTQQQGSLTTMIPGTKVPTSSQEMKAFGADKLIIAATKANKIFALESTTSEVVWQKYLGGDVIESNACTGEITSDSTLASGCAIWMKLLDPSASSRSELVVVVPLQVGATQRRVMWLDPSTGEVLHEELAPPAVPIISVAELPMKDKKLGKVHPLLLIDENRQAYTLPASALDAEKTLEENADRLFHYEVDTVNSVVQGYVVGGGQKSSHPSLPLWNLELGSVGEKILASASPLHREWEHVPVYIKGDASILYKYLNHNLLAVASTDTLSKGNTSSLNLYAIDAITGHVLHQSRIVGGSAPVHMVSCDNWVIMHYWNAKKTRFELTVLELFQAKTDDGPWNILFGPTMNSTKSAHHLEPPVPLQQTYIFPTGVTSMGVTSTLKGITPRSLIMALTTDHIFRISKDMLNPRRPHTGGSKDDSPTQFAPTKDEAIAPYAPIMPLRATDVLTHYNSMSKVNGIVSSPMALESTSLVFCYGLDLFFTPVQTAKAYDVLSPGFNYKLLYVSVIIVVALHIVTSYIASIKTLNERWK